MNPGGDPGRDDGMPPVDMEIPDDARELDRDLLAYRRELRARRRRARLHRLFAPLTEHGAIIPLIAACVALSMLAGALLSVFAIAPAAAPVLSQPAPPTAGTIPPSGAASPLPADTVFIHGKARGVRQLGASVLALAPPGCQCAAAMRNLASQARQAGVKVYVVGTNGTMQHATALARADGVGVAVPAKDPHDVLADTYHPDGLTAVLIRDGASTRVRRNLTAHNSLRPDLRRLTGR